MAEQLSAEVLLHWAHIAPFAPQLGKAAVSQTPFEQQPFGHEVESQMQVAFEHRVPTEHSGLKPHLHCPPAQLLARFASHWLHAPP